LGFAALAPGLHAAPVAANRWLDVEVLARDSKSIRLRLTNLSERSLHPVGARSWGTANFVKIGFELVPFPRRLRDGRWEQGRPDLDMGLASVRWTALDQILKRDLQVRVPVEVELPFPPPSERGNIELLVLARRGELWLSYRQTVGRLVILPGDARDMALRGALLALLGLLAFRSRRRSPDLPGERMRVTRRFAVGHSVVVLAAASLVLLYLHRLHYREFPYSDGVAYAALARSHMEGHGLTSPVILPGLMTLVPTSRSGQAFVIQAPLWPLLLSHVFRVFGATPLAVSVTGYVLGALAALLVWWIAVLVSQRAWSGYLGAFLLLTNPLYFAAIANGSTVPLQSLLVCGLVLLMGSPLRWWSAATAGALAGLGIVARENTIFAAAGLAICWLPELIRLLRHGPRRQLATTLVPALVLALLPVALEAARKSEALGRSGHPTLHATLLYGTGVIDSKWYWYYDPPGLRVDPRAYFAQHPGALWGKMRTQLGEAFLKSTLPALLTPSAWFVPVVFPWLFLDRRSARAGWCVLLSLALQAVGASISYLHPSYFLVFIAPLSALVAATVHALLERLFGSFGVLRKALVLAAAAYALAPLGLNLTRVTTPGGVAMGDYTYSPGARGGIMEFVRENTPPGAVIAFGHMAAPLIAWETRRVMLSYDPAPPTRPSNSAMWRRIDAQLPLDFILLSSFTDTETQDVLEGFEQVATKDTRDLKAWLFARRH